MEIRTCEEYVINELMSTKEELYETKQTLEEVIEHRNVILKSFQELRDLVCKLASVYNDNPDYTWIGFASVYSNWDKENFDKLVELVPEVLKPKDND